MKDLSSIVAKFNTQGTITEIKPLGTGLINDTYKVNTQEADAPDYVLQRINHAIFQNVEMLQSNIPIMQERLSETFRLCLPTFRKHWEKPSPTSITWNFVSNSYVMQSLPMLPDE